MTQNKCQKRGGEKDRRVLLIDVGRRKNVAKEGQIWRYRLSSLPSRSRLRSASGEVCGKLDNPREDGVVPAM